MFSSDVLEPVIGLEIHAQVNSRSKMFSNESTSFDTKANTCVSPVSLALPGALPTVNKVVVEKAILAGLALNCKVNLESAFARKHYFYPDLPKGFQITQSEPPLLEEGFVEVDGVKINIQRIHLEEDAGQSYHRGGQTFLNYNRAGVPLIEIVSQPDITSAAMAANYARKVRQVLRYLDVCDGNLQEGSFRCDCNVSLRPKGSSKLGTRVEIKNVGSFKFIEKAIDFELERLAKLIENSEEFFQQTRLFDPKAGETRLLRDKEDAKDYRHMPEPDLLVLKLEQKEVEQIKSAMCELPKEKEDRFSKELGLSQYDAENLCREKFQADYFESIVKMGAAPKLTANWILGELSAFLNKEGQSFESLKFSAADLFDLIQLIESGKISSKGAKIIFEKMCESGNKPGALVEELDLFVISDEQAILKFVEKVIEENQAQYEQYKNGKTKLFGFFVGKSLAASDGKADPSILNKVLKQRLG